METCGGRRIICLLCIDLSKLSVETPSLEASLHLPRHGRVSLASGSHHIWEQRHGSTTQPPERIILRAHVHTHNDLCTHTAYIVRYRHINTAAQLSAQCWLASPARPQGLGWFCMDTVMFIQLQSSLGSWQRAELGWGDGLRDCTTLTWPGKVLAQEREPRGTHAPSRQIVLGARCPKIAMARLLESLPLLGYTVGVSVLHAMNRQVCSCVH